MLSQLLSGLPPTLRCPGLSTYLAAMAAYSAVGIFHLTRPPRCWAHWGLVTVIASVLAGAWFSSRAILVDGLILGGFLSLVCSYLLERLAWT